MVINDRERELLDRFGLYFERAGSTQTAGRLVAWLMICDPPEQSITQLAEGTDVSKASVSTVARHLEEAGYLERVPHAGTRQHYYRLRKGGMTTVVKHRQRFLDDAAALGRDALELMGPDAARLETLREWTGLMEFMSGRLDALVEEWQEQWRDRQA
ncbi:MarR family transcriptional regulator [Spiractinospora alimapuensis]|uniref:GbsR/MarR family transcriptional regulator n=1 Tax=Spiractinospora alimapuensis TaxID=2820884 RepID=UPI001F351F54|nr:MarR family transcriptional regulator [Spiractinospora alimapuensis]QVQ54408.1 MarR family transcriptional regulator [Spiractinospora alimapuensis]